MLDVFFLSSGYLRVPEVAVGCPGRDSVTRSITGSLARRGVLRVTVAVCLRDDDTVVLVDTGLGHAICGRSGVAGALRNRIFGMEADSNATIARQLTRLGVLPERVEVIVATHLHLDHIGGASDFPRAEIV